MMILSILLGLAVLLVLAALVVANRPSTFQISRFRLIPTSNSVLFAEVNDLHRWVAWSPWARLDPNAKNTYAGADSGVGAIFHWEGNAKVGAGRMTIIESRPDELIRLQLDFLKPFQATNFAEFTFQPETNATRVTWSMTGTNTFVAKAVIMVFNCDKMIGKMFEDGLVNLEAETQGDGRP